MRLSGFAEVSARREFRVSMTVSNIKESNKRVLEASQSLSEPRYHSVRLNPQALRPLTRLSPWRFGTHILLEWTIIIGVAAACSHFWSPMLYIVSVIVIGARLHALGIMAHDGTHFLISRNRFWNDLITELFLAWPVFLSVTAYRAMHLNHHRHLNTEKDPDWARNEPDKLIRSPSWQEFIARFVGLWPTQLQLAAMVGHGAEVADPQVARVRRVFRVSIYLAVLGLGITLNSLDSLLLYWLTPLGTWFLVSMRIQGTSEHFAVESTIMCNSARTVTPNWLERFLIAPKNVNYHIEHHLYPGVPFYRLRQLHKELSGLPEFQNEAHITRSYSGFFIECLLAWRNHRNFDALNKQSSIKL